MILNIWIPKVLNREGARWERLTEDHEHHDSLLEVEGAVVVVIGLIVLIVGSRSSR